MGRPRKAAAMSTMIIGPAAAARPGLSAAAAAVRAGSDGGPARRSAAGRAARSRGRDPGAGPRPPPPRPGLLRSSVVMKRTLMTRNPAAMIRTTSRLGRKPTQLVRRRKGGPGEGQRAHAEGQGQARGQHRRDGLRGPFQRPGRNIPVARAMCFFSRERDRRGDERRRQDQVFDPDARILNPVWRNRLATSSTRRRAARAKMDRTPGNPLPYGRRGRAYWPRA